MALNYTETRWNCIGGNPICQTRDVYDDGTYGSWNTVNSNTSSCQRATVPACGSRIRELGVAPAGGIGGSSRFTVQPSTVSSYRAKNFRNFNAAISTSLYPASMDEQAAGSEEHGTTVVDTVKDEATSFGLAGVVIMVAGGLVGWYAGKKTNTKYGKWVGVVIGAGLGAGGYTLYKKNK